MNLEPLVSNALNFPYFNAVQFNVGEGSTFITNFCPKNLALASFYGVTGGQNGAINPPQSLLALISSEDLMKDIIAADGHTDASEVFHPLIQTFNDVQTFAKISRVRLIATNDSWANWKVIGYADVLLMLAEALNENGKTDEALFYLNAERRRAGLGDYTTLSKEEAREKIYLKRRLELSFEGHQWFDLLRTGRALQVMVPNGMKHYMTVFPIPLNQIQLINDPSIFPQNPGYD